MYVYVCMYVCVCVCVYMYLPHQDTMQNTLTKSTDYFLHLDTASTFGDVL